MKEAYVTFVMRNDSYIPGALVLAYRLRKLCTKKALVCLVTPSISETGKNGLSLLYDYVITVDEIVVEHSRRQERQDRPYLFTRFQALRLGKDGDLGVHFDKIVLLDADILPLKDYDTLFEVEAPAGIINEYKRHCICKEDIYRKDGKSIWHDHYEDVCPHGSPIPSRLTDKVLSNPQNMGVNACIWVLEPSLRMFQHIMKHINQEEVIERIQDFNWPEMQLATYIWSGKWHSIDIRYSAFNAWPSMEGIYGTHFAGLKPWSSKKMKALIHYSQFKDYQLWYQEFYEMTMWSYPMLKEIPKIKRLQRICETRLLKRV